MLVLTRRPNESVVLFVEGHRIEITARHPRRKTTHLAVEAPLAVRILRAELIEKQFGPDWREVDDATLLSVF